ncbi:C-14 sterol reductase [Trichoderma novae-zelandiae]
MAPANTKPKYDFGGPPGTAAIVFGLPVLLYFFYFTCNDVTGCPAPALLEPRSLSLAELRRQIPWPEDGIWGFASREASGWLMGYYLLSLVLYRALPGQELYGTRLRESGRPLKYKLNAFSSTLVQLAACAVGTYLYGADFAAWTFIDNNYLQLYTANLLLSYATSAFVYLRSFSVKPGNGELRELAQGGHTGNIMYDFFIGRWILLDLAFVAKQYRNYGYVSDSILFVTAVQTYYVLEGQYAEAGVLGMMDTTTDGLGFMLTFGDIVWVPFLYSTQTRYLSVYPLQLGWTGIGIVAAVFAVGVYIFRASNSQKRVFRTQPNHPSVKDMPYIQTKRGTRLLAGGWWGASRHINYFGDWLQASPFSLPTGVAGYLILPASTVASAGAGVATMLDGREVVQGAARGWGMVYTYFYVVYFASLLIHRERRDDAACAEKYGEDWDKYKKAVRWRILPGVY